MHSFQQGMRKGKRFPPGPQGFRSTLHAMQSFKRAGLYVRHAKYTDTTHIPAIIPVPQAYDTGAREFTRPKKTHSTRFEKRQTCTAIPPLLPSCMCSWSCSLLFVALKLLVVRGVSNHRQASRAARQSHHGRTGAVLPLAVHEL
jgi:hypothetical protein